MMISGGPPIADLNWGTLFISRKKNGQLGIGQRVYLVATPAWGSAWPAKIIADWMWFRDWISARKGRKGRMASPRIGQTTKATANALYVDFGRSKFGCGLVPAGVTDAMKKLASER